jgi:hypothetical protein
VECHADCHTTALSRNSEATEPGERSTALMFAS